MILLCRIGMHRPGADKVFHRGSHWTRCSHCGATLIRQGDRWRSLSRGYRVAWRARVPGDGFYHFFENGDRAYSRPSRSGSTLAAHAASVSKRRADGTVDRRSIAVAAKPGPILPSKRVTKSVPMTEPVLLRIDRNVLDWFKRQGSDWQAQVNAALRAAAGSQTRPILPYGEVEYPSYPERGATIDVQTPTMISLGTPPVR